MRNLEKKSAWTAEEDQSLLEIMERWRDGKSWSKVAEELGTGRTGGQVLNRWNDHIDPESYLNLSQKKKIQKLLNM